MLMDLSLLSKYRAQLMGFSILIIVFYHFFNIGGTSNVDLFLRKVFSQGYVGVDFFMFASGLGLTFSLSKTECLKDYYIKRWVRIFPFFTFITLIECFIIRGESLGLSFLRSTTIGYFVKGVPYIDWFIPALVGLYIVYPILYFKVIKQRYYKRAFFLMLFFVVLSCLASIFDILDWKHFALLYRIPIFILGAVTSSAIKYGYNPMLVRRVIVTYAVVGSIVAIVSKLLGGKNVIWLINAAFIPLYLYLLMNLFSYIHKKTILRFWGGNLVFPSMVLLH